MTFRSLIKVAEKYIIDNSPTLLSGIAVTGTLTVAYLTGRATFKAATIIAAEQANEDFKELGHPLDTKEKAKLVWKCYIPPAFAVVGTAGCIVVANHINASRMAALAAAYKLSERQYNEYKDKVVEKLGWKDEQAMRDEINEDHVKRNPPHDDFQILGDLDTVIFCEKWTGRYFRSTMATVKAAQNTINARMISDNYATLSDLYDEIGLENTQESSEIGWSIENPVQLYFTTTVVDGGSKPCFVMEYSNRPGPIRDYHSRYPGIH